MTRDHAAAELRRLAFGLAADDGGRLLERVAQRPDADALRAALVVEGATHVLRQAAIASERVSAAPVAAGASMTVGQRSRSAGRE